MSKKKEIIRCDDCGARAEYIVELRTTLNTKVISIAKEEVVDERNENHTDDQFYCEACFKKRTGWRFDRSPRDGEECSQNAP